MDYLYPDALVSTHWLEKNLSAKAVCIVDATYYLPNDGRSAIDEFNLRHIPGAVFFDIDVICDDKIQEPHMLPTTNSFSSKVGKLGLSNHDRIIVYDNSGGFMAACRVWWMFRVFGHTNVAVLNGGLPKWNAENRPLSSEIIQPQKKVFSAIRNNDLVKDLSQIQENIAHKKFQVIDARSSSRYLGIDDEPRPTTKKGHIPGSINIPFQKMLKLNENFIFRPSNEIQAVFDECKLNLNKPIVASCGSGVTAAVIILALHLIAGERGSVYDGSWAEWSNHPDTIVEI